jgi:DNA-binding MarR family transcriptional regulator
LIEETFAETLESYRLSRQQWQILNVLAETGCTLPALEEAVAPVSDSSEPNRLDAELESLQSGGLVAEKGGVHHLTDSGRAEFRRAREAVDGIWERMVQGFNEDEYDRTMQALEAMIDNLTT